MSPHLSKPGAGTQELRLATAMTGGVSLAIWMGGVARELDLLQQASGQREDLGLPGADSDTPAPMGDFPRPPGTEDAALYPDASSAPEAHVRALYLRLLELLDTTVATDVLAGTSAGGINAALLGLSRVNDFDLGPLRDIWLRVGAFEQLLRDPRQDKPPSLLQGDGVLLAGVQKGIEELWTGGERDLSERPHTRVFMTTTLLAGETSRFTDAYGTLVQDVDHHGLFTFSQDTLGNLANVPAVALAARASASFPFAFEPGFLSLDGDDRRPAMKAHLNITRSHWVADGGLLMNRPINPLLQEIFDRPAERHVRRVLLYVVPTAGDDPDPRESVQSAAPSSPPTLGGALISDVGAVFEQSIASDLRAFRQHNDRVDALVDTRLRMAQLALRMRGRLLTADMLEDYRSRQSDWFARPLVSALMRAITALPEQSLPEPWKEQLKPGSGIDRACRTAGAAAAREPWDEQGIPKPTQHDVLEKYGPAAYEGAKAAVIAMLRAGFVLGPTPVEREELGKALKRVHSAVRFARPDVQQYVNGAVADQVASPSVVSLDVLAGTITRGYARELTPEPGALRAAWGELASVVQDELELLYGLAPARSPDSPPGPRHGLPARERAGVELRTYLDYLVGNEGSSHGAAEIALALFDLHVATRSVLPVAVEIEQRVELVQLSADTRTLLDKRRTAAQKLTGMQLHHFGAFYKSSWRANDWAWGRLDGAGWLVHLLLDPRRVRAITERRRGEHGVETPAQWFLAQLQTNVLPRGEPVTAPDDVREELKFLNDAEASDPPSLPVTALWIAQEGQRWIAAAELPVVAREILATPSSHKDAWASEVLKRADPAETAQAASLLSSWLVAHGRSTLGAYRLAQHARSAATNSLADPPPSDPTAPEQAAPTKLAEMLASCPVPDEKLDAEFGQPLLTRTATKGS